MIVNEQHLASRGLQRNFALSRFPCFEGLFLHGTSFGAREPVPMRPWYNFDATRTSRRVVKCSPKLQLWTAVYSPESPIILVPWKLRTRQYRLVP